MFKKTLAPLNKYSIPWPFDNNFLQPIRRPLEISFLILIHFLKMYLNAQNLSGRDHNLQIEILGPIHINGLPQTLRTHQINRDPLRQPFPLHPNLLHKILPIEYQFPLGTFQLQRGRPELIRVRVDWPVGTAPGIRNSRTGVHGAVGLDFGDRGIGVRGEAGGKFRFGHDFAQGVDYETLVVRESA
jgi:hypothetical protein